MRQIHTGGCQREYNRSSSGEISLSISRIALCSSSLGTQDKTHKPTGACLSSTINQAPRTTPLASRHCVSLTARSPATTASPRKISNAAPLSFSLNRTPPPDARAFSHAHQHFSLSPDTYDLLDHDGGVCAEEERREEEQRDRRRTEKLDHRWVVSPNALAGILHCNRVVNFVGHYENLASSRNPEKSPVAFCLPVRLLVRGPPAPSRTYFAL